MSVTLTADLDGRQHESIVAHGTCKAKVTQLDDAVFAEQNVLRLHVTVKNTSSVEVIQSRHQLGGYRPNLHQQHRQTAA